MSSHGPPEASAHLYLPLASLPSNVKGIQSLQVASHAGNLYYPGAQVASPELQLAGAHMNVSVPQQQPQRHFPGEGNSMPSLISNQLMASQGVSAGRLQQDQQQHHSLTAHHHHAMMYPQQQQQCSEEGVSVCQIADVIASSNLIAAMQRLKVRQAGRQGE